MHLGHRLCELMTRIKRRMLVPAVSQFDWGSGEHEYLVGEWVGSLVGERVGDLVKKCVTRSVN
jgi:hypothetical protein